MQPGPQFDHLARMTTPLGLFEHALLTSPRVEHGYCLDDVARGLVVAVREPDPRPEVRAMVGSYLQFAVAAQDSRGTFHNRRRADGSWSDATSANDHWGRAVWAVGLTAALTGGEVREQALAVATRGMRARSPYPRAMAYAALGAVEVLRTRPAHRSAVRLLKDARSMLPQPSGDPSWPWPEPRLAYANAVLPEALLAIGATLDDQRMLQDGLLLLTWLLDTQTRGGHLSVVPAGGWQLGDPSPGFDQQPIEVAALAEACWRAHEVTGDDRWLAGVVNCADWFFGANDGGTALYDSATGGCCDGLLSDGVNLNQGAESTLAALSTLQIAQRAPLLVAH